MCYSRKKAPRVFMIRGRALPRPLYGSPAPSPLPGEAGAATEHSPSPLLCLSENDPAAAATWFIRPTQSFKYVSPRDP